MIPAKPLYQSKVLWTNLLVAVAAILVELSNVPDLGVDPKWVIVALAVVNAGLRFLTTQPVAGGAEPPPFSGVEFYTPPAGVADPATLQKAIDDAARRAPLRNPYVPPRDEP